MINFIRSVKLRAITPNTTNIDFDRERVVKGEAEVELTIQSEFSENTEKEQCKLTFSAEAKSASENPFLTAIFSVDYIFGLTDKESYNSMSTDDKGCLCANLVFMDFRRKLQATLATVGMSSIKLPLSLIDITSDQ